MWKRLFTTILLIKQDLCQVRAEWSWYSSHLFSCNYGGKKNNFRNGTIYRCSLQTGWILLCAARIETKELIIIRLLIEKQSNKENENSKMVIKRKSSPLFLEGRQKKLSLCVKIWNRQLGEVVRAPIKAAYHNKMQHAPGTFCNTRVIASLGFAIVFYCLKTL